MEPLIARYPPRLVQISNDPPLASSRSMLLRSAGWHTVTCNTRDLAPADFERYDLLLFCQTVSLQVVSGIARTVTARGNRSTALLRIAWANDVSFDPRFRTLIAPVSPGELIESARASVKSADAAFHSMLLTTRVEAVPASCDELRKASAVALH